MSTRVIASIPIALALACRGDDAETMGDSTSGGEGGTTTGTGTGTSTGTTTSTGDGSTSESDTGGVDSTSAGDSTTGEPSCIDFDLLDVFPIEEEFTNEGQSDDIAGSCTFGRGGLDYTLAWMAPAAGTYRIETGGSTYDTVLFLLDGCGGEEIACNDDIEGGGFPFTSSLDVDLAAGEQVVIVVDGYDAVSIGSFVLAIHQVACMPSVLAGPPPFVEMGTTVDMANDDWASCGGEGAHDVFFAWTPAESAIYSVDLEGSGYDTVLWIKDACFGTEIACNDDGTPEPGPSKLLVPLQGGQEVLLGVDGYGIEQGPFVLSVDQYGLLEGDCCAPDATPGCVDFAITECMCGQIEECCTEAWTQLCVGIANNECNAQCPLVPAGSCCAPTGMPGCDTPIVQDCVCSYAPSCCDTEWTQACADQAVIACAAEC